jgi:hypothetical protein
MLPADAKVGRGGAGYAGGGGLFARTPLLVCESARDEWRPSDGVNDDMRERGATGGVCVLGVTPTMLWFVAVCATRRGEMAGGVRFDAGVGILALGGMGVSGGAGPIGTACCSVGEKCLRGGGITATCADWMSDVCTAVDVHVATPRLHCCGTMCE